MHRRLAISIYSKAKCEGQKFHALYCVSGIDPEIISSINTQIKRINTNDKAIIKFSRYNDYQHNEIILSDAEEVLKNISALKSQLVAMLQMLQWNAINKTEEILENWECCLDGATIDVYDLVGIHQSYLMYIDSEFKYLEELIDDIQEFNNALEAHDERED